MADYTLNIIVIGQEQGLPELASGIQGVATAAQGAEPASSGFFSSLFKNATNIASSIGLLKGFGDAIMGVGASLIGGNAQFENFEARFATLLGSTDAAKQKIADLSSFASTTPFDLPGVVQAATNMRQLGGASFDTKGNLALIGNAAAAAGQPIQDVSFWMSRAYGAIQAGQPFGEASMRLQEMGVMSGATALKVTALQKSGADSAQVWAAFAGGLNAPTDAMAKLGMTWDGLSSTLEDTWAGLVRTFAQPLFNTLKPELSELITTLSSSGLQDAVASLGQAFADVLAPAISFVAGTVIPGVVAAIQFIAPAVGEAISVLSQVGAIFGELAGEAMGWGQNIISQLAGGMMDAAGEVIGILQSIGGMIADLLMPGSPPKLLPQLDTWGTGAINAYMEGWGQADFGVFNSISDGIKGALDGIAKASGDKGMNVAQLVLGSQDDIAKAIDEIHNLGSVSEGTFNNIIAAAGPAGPQVSGLVRAYLDLESATQNVSRAQEELNGITDAYAAQLDPLKAQLKGLQDQKQAIQDQQRLADLQKTVADAATDGNKRQLALLEIQEIQLRQNIRTTEAERDTAVDAAKQKLDAAKAEQASAKQRVDTQKALLDAQNKQNSMIAEQTKALKGAAGAMKAHADAAKPMGEALQKISTVVGGAKDSIDAVSTSFFNVRMAIGQALTVVQPFTSLIQNNLGPILAGIGTVIAALVLPSIVGFVGTLGSLAVAAAGSVAAFTLMAAPLVALGVAAALLYQAWVTNFGGIQQIIMPIVDAVTQGFGQGGILGAIMGLITGLSAALPALIGWFGTALGAIVIQLAAWGQAFVDWISPYVSMALAALGAYAAQLWAWIAAQAPIWLQQLASWGLALISWVAPYAAMAVQALGAWLAGLWAWVATQAPGWMAQLAAWGQALIAWVAPMIPPAIAALGALATSLFSWIGAQVGPLLAQLGAWAQAFVAWIVPATTQFLAAWPAMLSSFLDWIAGAVGPILAQLALWAGAFLTWIGPMIPPFLAQIGAMIPPLLVALAGIALAIATWVAETAVVLVAKVATWAAALLGWVKTNVLPALPGVLAGILTAITSFLSGVASSIVSEAAKLGKAIIDGIKNGISGAVGALTDAVKNAAKSALDAAKGALGIKSPSTVMAEQVGAPIVTGITMGIDKATPKLTEKMLDLANKLIDVVSKGVDAFGKIGQLGQIPSGAIATFAATIQETLNTFSQTVVQWDKASMSAASQFTKKAGDVIEIMSKGVDFFTKLDALRTVPDAQIRDFVRMLGTAMNALIEISSRDMRIALMAAVEFAGGAGKLLEVIGKGVDGLSKLSSFTPIPLAAFQAFRVALKSAIYTFTTAAAEWATAPIAAATAFADSSGKILAVIGSGAEALGKLGAFVGVPLAVFGSFRVALKSAIYTFVQATAEWAAAPITASVQFATASATILDAIGKGVDGLDKLRDFAPIPLAAFVAFREALQQGVGALITVTQLFQAQAVDAAATFATNAGKMLGIIGGAIDGFTKLRDFGGVADAAFVNFTSALFYTVQLFVLMAGNWAADAVDAAGTFATGAGKTTAIIGQAVDGFTKLTDFKGVADAAFVNFTSALFYTVELFTGLATNWSVQAVEAAGVFATGAGKMLAIVGSAVEGFVKLADFKGVSDAAIAAFGVALSATVRAMVAISATFAADAVEAAGVFATGAGKAVAIVGSGVEGFVKLVDFKGVSADAVAAFGAALQLTLQRIAALAALWSADGLAAAITFADAASKATGAIASALDAFKKLGDYQTTGPEVVKGFADSLNAILAALQNLAPPAAHDLGVQIMNGLIAGILSMRTLLMTSMVAAVMSAVLAAKTALGIQSPSTVLEQQVGLQMSAGVARGIAGGAFQVSSAMGALAGAAPGALGAGSGGGVSIVFEPGAIVQQPGQDGQQLANYVIAEIQRRAAGRGTF